MELDLNVLIWSIINLLVFLSIPISLIVFITKSMKRQRRIEERLEKIEAQIKAKENS